MFHKRAISRHILALVLTVFISTLFSFSANAASCKGKSQSSCSANNDCSWVSSYKRKDGTKVSSHCRANAGKGSANKSKEKSSHKKPNDKNKHKKDVKNKKSKKDKKKAKNKKSKKDKKDKKSKKDKKDKKKSKKKDH